MNYTETIERTSLELSRTTLEIGHLREQIAEVEAIEQLEIINAKNGESKPLFTNETARGAALTLRLRENAEARELKKMLEEQEQRRSLLAARLERLRGEFKLHLLDRHSEIIAHSTPIIA